VVERAEQEKSPVAIFDPASRRTSTSATSSTDNYKGGVMAAERMAGDPAKGGNIAIIRDQPGARLHHGARERLPRDHREIPAD